MFGDLFEEDEDFSILPSSPNTNGKKSHPRDSKTPEPQGDTRLSGLRNQGGTCYLNSLLRTLFFTPEFREALFALGPKELGSLEEKDTPESQVRIIPLQLQRLFAQLLLLDQQALSTTDLTESFGWNSSEETSQHDVQELNRILFSAHWRAHLAMTSSSDCTMAPLLTASSARSVATSVKGSIIWKTPYMPMSSSLLLYTRAAVMEVILMHIFKMSMSWGIGDSR
ncbi:ubiquitin carboxyl-terminal hydrolase 40 isoform X3 [Xenopus tropicalis]|uniref:Ubiquitin carboxyl-terminal hydrolase 40 isoform X2 n=1 Tax=Xenopus tropicalis TaxID=8364 RepID=A0A8J1JXL4_XENTR|nr:ubiquitin carboxyl-terminal hydrolase 40 isoform X2 [Xenopus tropicalis]XP_031762639.1 ubiquitin carboxyl-terminal hydrolase 40 isoform X3 [Xenopus tropicalis]|eukprot:XP_017945531.1 PREDICTED: ubiquitin carboxyl-terminal hydrolase 40-like isoform X2 [Xenopus tropicalis]